MSYAPIVQHPALACAVLLSCSNLFMTFAWYGHLKHLQASPLWVAVLVSWGIALFEYALMVPANRIGYRAMSIAQLALAWCLRRPAVASVIIGATRPEQVVENARASGARLADDVLARMEAV